MVVVDFVVVVLLLCWACMSLVCVDDAAFLPRAMCLFLKRTQPPSYPFPIPTTKMCT